MCQSCPSCIREQQQPPCLSHEVLTMHRNTVGLTDDQKVIVLVDNPSAQCLGEHVGVDSLQLLCVPH